MELARRAFGADHPVTLDFQWGYSRAFTLDKAPLPNDLPRSRPPSKRRNGPRGEFADASTRGLAVMTGDLRLQETSKFREAGGVTPGDEINAG